MKRKKLHWSDQSTVAFIDQQISDLLLNKEVVDKNYKAPLVNDSKAEILEG